MYATEFHLERPKRSTVLQARWAACRSWHILKMVMTKEYIEQRKGAYYIAGSRVSLDSVVYAFLKGESPEGIAESFPALGLEQIFGALAFYMANREVVDRYLSEGEREFELMRQQARRDHPALYAKLDEARRRTQIPIA
jgi:uncharacterized protein (DUF433 family)